MDDLVPLREKDACKSVTWLAGILLFWCGIQFACTPMDFSRAFRTLLAMHMVAGGIALGFFVGSWRRPKIAIAMIYSLVAVGGTLVLIPWATLENPTPLHYWQSMAAAQISFAAIPLIVPAVVGIGYVLVALVGAEVVFLYLYANAHGMQMPLLEPYSTLAMASVGISVLWMRGQRRRTELEHNRLMSEGTAMLRLKPMLDSLQSRLAADTNAVSEILSRASLRDALSNTSGEGPVLKLSALSCLLSDLNESASEHTERSVQETERVIMARDSHLGALLFAICAMVCTICGFLGVRNLPGIEFVRQALCVGFLVYLAFFLWLLFTLDRPTNSRNLFATFALFAAAASLLGVLKFERLMLQPMLPFIGMKLLIAGAVIVRQRGLFFGFLVETIITLEALAFLLIDPQTAALSSMEPWHTLVFWALGIGFFTMGEQRRVASVRLLRAKAEATAIRRQAELVLAMRDQLNTPLQALMLHAFMLEKRRTSDSDVARLRKELDRLAALSRELYQFEKTMPEEIVPISFDGGALLKPVPARARA